MRDESGSQTDTINTSPAILQGALNCGPAVSVPTDVMAARSLASSRGALAPRDDARERVAMTSVGTDTEGPLI